MRRERERERGWGKREGVYRARRRKGVGESRGKKER
jgi:hypothetical protein